MSTAQLAYLGLGLAMLGVGVTAYFMVTTPESPGRRTYTNYVRSLSKELRALQSSQRPQAIVNGQAAVVGLSLAIFFLWGDILFLGITIAGAFLPLVMLRSRRVERVKKIDKQVDGWLLALANALKATPSLGDALASSASLTQAPLSEEIEVALKELSLGSPMSEALQAMAERINSPTMWGAIATLQVARNTGGNVPQILEEAASTLREMERLEAVVRTKTADGRSQAFVLAFMPFIVVAGIHFIDPNWLAPLTQSATGLAVLGAAAALWIAGFVSARKILAVDV